MRSANRRAFLADVGKGMVIAGVGASIASELGISIALADHDDKQLAFGDLRPLVDLMQESPVDQLQPQLVKQLQAGETNLRQLVAAAALANAETFGGEDYVGYHAEMALIPALQMAAAMPKPRRPLPVLKVLYRNTDQIQRTGGAGKKRLRPIEGTPIDAKAHAGELLREMCRGADMKKAERMFATISQKSLDDAFNDLLYSVEDDINVHRFVLAHRAKELVGVVGQQHAHTMLRQCVRYCVDHEQSRIEQGGEESPIRRMLPTLINQHRLLEKELGDRDPGDAWVQRMCDTVYRNGVYRACDAVAGALAEGIAPDVIGEAISLAANQLVLCQSPDRWRAHGDASGVHASDAANAWRNMVRTTDHRNTVAGLIVSAYHTARYRPFSHPEYPYQEHRDLIKSNKAATLLGAAEEAICGNDQARAAAAIQIYGEQGYDVDPVFQLMLKYAVSEDGRLHAEKYYHTVVEEYATTRPAYRWRQMVALARVTASSYGYDRKDNQGYRAPGYVQACQLLKVQA